MLDIWRIPPSENDGEYLTYFKEIVGALFMLQNVETIKNSGQLKSNLITVS